MKKVIRLTESDLYNLVKRVINEQSKIDFDYFFRRDTGVTDLSDTYETIYFKKDGNTYQVFADKDKNGGVIKAINVQLPNISELGLVASNGGIKYNESVGNAVSIASLITPGFDSYNKPKVGIFVNEEGIPVKCEIRKENLPEDVLAKEGEGHKIKDGQVALKNDYFILPEKQNGYVFGQTIGFGKEIPAERV